MIKIIINSNDTCLAKYIDKPIVSLYPRTKINVVCGSCNLSYITNQYYNNNYNGKKRFVASCKHCGKWNRLNLYTMGVKERRFLTTF
jgi:RNase P subunit RPR2